MTAFALDLDAGLRELLEHWLSLRARLHRLPTRRDLDPCAFATILGSEMLVEVHWPTPGRARARLRLVGEIVNAQALRGELSGSWLDEVCHPEECAQILDHLIGCLDSGQPRLDRSAVRRVDGVQMVFQRLCLPLAPRAGEPAMVLCGLRCDPQPFRRTFTPDRVHAPDLAAAPFQSDGYGSERLWA